jgi:hypothetical protein
VPPDIDFGASEAHHGHYLSFALLGEKPTKNAGGHGTPLTSPNVIHSTSTSVSMFAARQLATTIRAALLTTHRRTATSRRTLRAPLATKAASTSTQKMEEMPAHLWEPSARDALYGAPGNVAKYLVDLNDTPGATFNFCGGMMFGREGSGADGLGFHIHLFGVLSTSPLLIVSTAHHKMLSAELKRA